MNPIEAIFFDMNGTLRRRLPDAGWQQRHAQKLLTMLGRQDAPASFLDELTQRYQSYTLWADEKGISLSEKEIWTRWIAPDLPHEFIESRAVELMLAFRLLRGPHVLNPDALSVLAGLNQHGYRLGIISNTTSTTEIPNFIDAWGMRGFFEVVVLSSACGVRKPNPEIFWRATRALQVEPVRCAYIGNKVSSDVIGAHRAGFSLAMLLEPYIDTSQNGSPEEKPERVLHQLKDLLEVFPARAID